MAKFDYSQLRSQTGAALDRQGSDAGRIVMIHSGVVIGLGLLLSVLSYLLDQGIAGTGGLSGIGARAMLETLQMVLQTANLVLLPFWTMGYTRAILSISRGEQVDARSLLWGFGNFGVVLRSMLLKGVILFALAIVGGQLASILFALTPAAKPMFELLEQMSAEGMTDPYAMLEHPAYQQLVVKMLPFMLVGMLLLLVPVFYRLRFADLVLVDRPQNGAVRSFLVSLHITKRKSLAVFRLDLYFWWFYLAQGLILALGYGDVLLAMAGVNLGISADAAMFVFYIVALLCEFGLYVWRKNHVQITYALAYDELIRDAVAQAQPAAQSAPQNTEETI